MTDANSYAAGTSEDGSALRATTPAGLESLMDMSLPIAIEFGRASMTIQEVLDLSPGSVLQLDRMVGEPIDVYVSDRRLAEGEIVVLGEHFGVRITRLLTPQRDAAARASGA